MHHVSRNYTSGTVVKLFVTVAIKYFPFIRSSLCRLWELKNDILMVVNNKILILFSAHPDTTHIQKSHVMPMIHPHNRTLNIMKLMIFYAAHKLVHKVSITLKENKNARYFCCFCSGHEIMNRWKMTRGSELESILFGFFFVLLLFLLFATEIEISEQNCFWIIYFTLYQILLTAQLSANDDESSFAIFHNFKSFFFLLRFVFASFLPLLTKVKA